MGESGLTAGNSKLDRFEKSDEGGSMAAYGAYRGFADRGYQEFVRLDRNSVFVVCRRVPPRQAASSFAPPKDEAQKAVWGRVSYVNCRLIALPPKPPPDLYH
ncbi:MAG: hypothetical protein RR977_02190 [Oscillospiraceae bacterium]